MNAHAKVDIGHSGLPARLPVDLRARRRAAGRRPHRPRAWRGGQQLHGRRHLRQGRALRGAHPPPRPAAAPAAPQTGQRLRPASSASPGTTRSTSPPRLCWRPSAATARRPSGPTTTPAPWASSCATASTACATPSATPACTPPICTTLAWTGYIAGTGKLAGPDPREMAKSDLVVIWGTNPVNTQVNVMTHAMRARKQRGAKIVAIDIYQQRHHAAGRPGAVPAGPAPTARWPAPSCTCCSATATPTGRTWSKYTDCPRELEAHLRDTHAAVGERDHRPRRSLRSRPSRRMVGTTPRSLLPAGLRLRALAQRRPQHARRAVHPDASPAPGCNEGGGGFHNNGAIYHWNKIADRRPRRRRSERAHARPCRASARC